MASAGRQRAPVGCPRVQKCEDAVVREVAQLECCSFDPFDEVVECFGGLVRDSGLVPVGDLGQPAGEGTSELVHLRRAGLVLEVGGETGGVFDGDGGIVDPVDASDRSLAGVWGFGYGGGR